MTHRNVLVLTGSPRLGGNSDLMADAFIKGAESAGHTVTRFAAGQKSIGGCKACSACWSTGRACVFDDAFAELEPLLENADVLAFAMPLYWYSWPAQLKAAVDKFNAYLVPACKKKLRLKESLLMMCCADETESSFDGAVTTYRQIAGFLKLQDRGTLLVPGVSAKGEITSTGALDRAEALGAGL